MPDEQNYESHLLEIQEAVRILQESRYAHAEHLLRQAYALWANTTSRLYTRQMEQENRGERRDAVSEREARPSLHD